MYVTVRLVLVKICLRVRVLQDYTRYVTKLRVQPPARGCVLFLFAFIR